MKEFYAGYNQISDLAPLYYIETLEVLDLEGNEIEDESNVDCLETLPKLVSLNMKFNPITEKASYSKLVKEKVK